jgi:hypothetical protein
VLLTRADQAKRLLVDLLQAQTGVGQPFNGCQIDYSDQGQEQWRESIYLGRVESEIDGEAEIKLELARVPLFVRVTNPAATAEENDQRAVVLAEAVQDVLEANPKPFGATSWWDIRALELEGSRTGDEAVSTLTLAIEIRAYL